MSIKIIYTENCGLPLKIIITDDILKRIIEIQKALKNLDQKKTEDIEWRINDIKDELDEFNFMGLGQEPYLIITKDSSILKACDQMCENDLMHDVSSKIYHRNLSEVPDIFFSRMFVYYCKNNKGIDRIEEFQEVQKLMPKEHIDLLKKIINKEKKK